MNKAFAPFAVFAVVVLLAALPLLRGKDPSLVPSALLEKPVPEFNLPAALKKSSGFSPADLKKGKVSVVNFFASWCVSCVAEQALLEKLSKTVPVYGFAYKDKQADLAKWLETHGNPFTGIAADSDGRMAIDWGVYGVPETFVIDGKGVIRYRHVGPVTEDAYESIFLPLITELEK